MVKDVRAPAEVITSRILDFDAYPRMIKGCDSLEKYEERDEALGVHKHIVKAKYHIHAMHMHFTYFMTHEWDPDSRCMVFHLDYDKRSDIDDSVGYWVRLPLRLGKLALPQRRPWLHCHPQC